MSLTAVRGARPPGISVPSRTRSHLRSEADYETLQWLVFRLSLSICLVGLRRGFERAAVRLAMLPGISALSQLLSVADKELVRGGSTRDGLQG
jgi:hypothetical protein